MGAGIHDKVKGNHTHLFSLNTKVFCYDQISELSCICITVTPMMLPGVCAGFLAITISCSKSQL